MSMLPQHWLLILVVFLIAYAIGARYPSTIPYIGTA